MRKFVAVDCEGSSGPGGLIGVAFYSDRGGAWLVDKDVIRITLYALAQDGYTFLAHNAEYDVPVIWGQLGLKPTYTFYNDRLHHAAWKYDRKRPAAQIWDTFDLSGGLSVARLGEAMSLPKYPTPQRLLGKDADRYEWKCEQHGEWECEECYAVRDAEIVYQFADRFRAVLGGWGVELGPRLAGTARHVWRALDQPGVPGIRGRRFRQIAREAYYGGRTECFKLGRLGLLFTADIASCYPAAMLETPMPDPATLSEVRDLKPAHLPLSCEGVAEVEIAVPPCHVPPLPYTHRGVRIYPVGRLRGTWTLLELRHAISTGAQVTAVYRVVYTQDRLYPFVNTINTLWTLREAYKQGHDPRQLVAKLLMNNLYGRLGAKETPERLLIKHAPRGYSNRTSKVHYGHDYINGELYLTQIDEMHWKQDWSNVMWAAQITSAVRVKLHKLMLLQGVSLAYCDTDSIFSTQPIQGMGQGLGQLEAKGEYKDSIISQPKLYALQDFHGEWRPKAKGVHPDVALRFLAGQRVTHESAIGVREGLRRGLEPGSWEPVSHERRHVPYRRQVLSPQRLAGSHGRSETDPPVVGPMADYGEVFRG